MKLSSERGSYDYVKKVAALLVSQPGQIRPKDLEYALGAVRGVLGMERITGDGEMLKVYSDAFKAASGAAKAALALELSEILLELGRAGDAALFLQSALGERPGHEVERRLFIALADAARLQGDRKAAKAAVEAADAIKLERTNVQETAMAGALALSVEDYIADGRSGAALAALRRWDWEAPLEKLAGYSSYLYGRVYLAQGRKARALREFDAVAAVSPESPWAPKALISAANLLASQGDFSAAAGRLDRIIREYRTSPESDEARKMLKRMGRTGKGNVK